MPKIHVKTPEGELTFQTWAEFQTMWKHKFIGPDDLVRRGDTSAKWTRAGDLPELRGMAVRDNKDDRRLFLITLAFLVFGLAIVLALRAVLLAKSH